MKTMRFFKWCISTIVIAIIWSSDVHGQTDEFCGTPFSKDPNFNQADFEAFRRRLDVESRDVRLLPFQAHIVRHSDGSGGFKPEQLQEVLDTMNTYFVDAGIQFVLTENINYVDKDIIYDFDRSRFQDTLLAQSLAGVMNVYFINKVLNDASFLCGYAQFPWNGGDYVVVKNDCATNGSTLAHEVGHYLGLLHTHETANGIEAVERINCTFAGDGLCDTPADPRLGSNNVNDDCEYTGRGRDYNGNSYLPDPRNLMSYSLKSCRDRFSDGQLERMLFYLDRDRTYLSPLTSSRIKLKASQLKIFPNPTSDEINISFKHPVSGLVKLRVVNVQGKVLIEKDIDKQNQYIEERVSLSTLPSGLFRLLILTREGMLSQSLIKA